MNAMTNNHIGTEDAIGEGGRDFYRMSRSDIEGVALENAVIERNLGKGLRVGKYHFEFVRECTLESDLPPIQPHMFIDNEHRLW